MPGRECYHCKQWIDEGEPHDCWTTTEAALTRDLTEDLRDAWERLRETAAELGEQRIYASHHSIMFSRKSCYFFVRPKKAFLEVSVFLGRPLKAPQIRRANQSSKSKFVNVFHVRHRDEVEAPISDWLREAYQLSDVPAAPTKTRPVGARQPARSPKPKAKPHAKPGGALKAKPRPKTKRAASRFPARPRTGGKSARSPRRGR